MDALQQRVSFLDNSPTHAEKIDLIYSLSEQLIDLVHDQFNPEFTYIGGELNVALVKEVRLLLEKNEKLFFRGRCLPAQLNLKLSDWVSNHDLGNYYTSSESAS